jgi:hypothetical protein
MFTTLPTELVAEEHYINFRRVILSLGGLIVSSVFCARGYYVTAAVPTSILDGTHPVFS